MSTLEEQTESFRSEVSGGRAAAQWLHVVTHLDPRYGGLSAAVPQLSNEIAVREQSHMYVAAFCSPGELYSVTAYSNLNVSEWPAGRSRWLRERRLRQHFGEFVAGMDGVHLHGLWEQSTATGVRAAKAHGIPYVISAHGMLDRWALQQRAFKKVVYAALVERPSLNRAACLHALTASEAVDYRRFGCTAPIAIIPNGVRVPTTVTSAHFFRQHPELRGKRIVLFLGRMHAKKGLDLLIQAWQSVAAVGPDVHLVLAGPDFEDTRSRLEVLAETLGLRERILFVGMLRDEQKWSALAAAECFVLPSFSEGFSISVLEAMGVGLPVIISDRCNLPEVATLGAGYVIPPEVKPLEDALSEILRRSPEVNRAAGACGRAFVLSNYSWAVVAGKMAQVYRWVLGVGAEPDTLLRDDVDRGTRDA